MKEETKEIVKTAIIVGGVTGGIVVGWALGKKFGMQSATLGLQQACNHIDPELFDKVIVAAKEIGAITH